jgi:hypothetical protein
MQKPLYLFDVDDTLIVTDPLLEITNGTVTKRVTTAEFRDMKNAGKLGEWKVDFSAFRDPERVRDTILKGRPGPGVPLLHKWYTTKDAEFGILTSRSGDEDTLRSVLTEFLWGKTKVSWRPKKELTFCTNHSKYGMVGQDASEQKVYFVNQLWETKQYEQIILVDDDPAHLEALKKWAAIGKYPKPVSGVQVFGNGKFTWY